MPETERERLNRNFNELLQELRVLQTGVQILLAFMLTLPFAAGFDRLDATQRRVYGVALLLVAAAMALLMGPVAAHRATFRRRLKPHVIRIAHQMMIGGLGLLLLAVICAVEVAAWAALGSAWAAWITGVLAALLLGCWVVVPVLLRVGPFAPEPEPATVEDGDSPVGRHPA